jgi:hypothetical protein
MANAPTSRCDHCQVVHFHPAQGMRDCLTAATTRSTADDDRIEPDRARWQPRAHDPRGDDRTTSAQRRRPSPPNVPLHSGRMRAWSQRGASCCYPAARPAIDKS